MASPPASTRPTGEPSPSAVPPGRIDIHSHLIPGVDDGCADFSESVESVRRLKAQGYVGTVCTPHIWPELFPNNLTDAVRKWAASLQAALDAEGLDYRLWSGGELRFFEGVNDWLRDHEAPTLAGSRCLLLDFWADAWPAWANRAFERLLAEGYQPILAHPERLRCGAGLRACLDAVTDMGVWLQGNFRCLTGEEGPAASRMVRELLRDDRYALLALDMHRPAALESRFDGLKLVEREFGRDTVERLTAEAPRRLVLGIERGEASPA